MALQDKLDAFTAELVSGGPPYNIPSFVIDTFRKGTAELIASGQASLALKAGQQAPGFTLKDSEGATFSSDRLLSRGPLRRCDGRSCQQGRAAEKSRKLDHRTTCVESAGA